MKEEQEDNTEGESSSNGGVKVPESFQKDATALVEGCDTVHCLDFLSSLVSDQRKKLMSSQKKAGLMTNDFSTEGMPS